MGGISWCRIDKARKRTQLDAKLHWNAVTADYLTKSFTHSQAYSDNSRIGAWLYEQQGFAQGYTQGLMGTQT